MSHDGRLGGMAAACRQLLYLQGAFLPAVFVHMDGSGKDVTWAVHDCTHVVHGPSAARRKRTQVTLCGVSVTQSVAHHLLQQMVKRAGKTMNGSESSCRFAHRSVGRANRM
jgi:hypothetical protein